MSKLNYNETLEEVKTWRDAVCIVIDEKLKNYECFSSGEITKEIRINRPDLRFSHWDVGQFMRDLYYNGSMTYGTHNDYTVAVHVPRRTSGNTRTPANMEVFVYGENYNVANSYRFEVEIPRAQGDLSLPYDEYGTQQNEGPKRSFDKNEKLVATVQGDSRLAIPRAAFDSFMQKTGKSIAFGDKIYIAFDEAKNKVSVTLSENKNTKAYDLTRDRGRVKYKPESIIDWVSGDKFQVDVTNDGLEIDVSCVA